MLLIDIKESSFMNKIVNILNLTIIFVILIAGGIKADFGNWIIDDKVFTLNMFLSFIKFNTFFAQAKIFHEI